MGLQTGARVLEHPGDGKVTLKRWLEMYEAHVTKYIEQMRRYFSAWEQTGQPASFNKKNGSGPFGP